MADARSSVLMDARRGLLLVARRLLVVADRLLVVAQQILVVARHAAVRATRWSFAAVEDEASRDVVPVPGPAHGPVPAIRLRVEGQRRRAS